MKRLPILLLVALCLLVQAPAQAFLEDSDDIVIGPKEVSTSGGEETPPPPNEVAEPIVAVQPAPPAATQATKNKTVTVKSGDTLWDIAQRLLGDGSRFWEIVKLNAKNFPTLLNNPNLIFEGWELEIPVKETAKESGAKPAGASAVAPGTKPGTEARPGDKPASKPAPLPALTVAQKTVKLQDALNRMNLSLLPQGKTVTQLNTYTVRLMIDKGFITEEQWMALNPPNGYRWVIEKGKVSLINHAGKPITTAEVAKVNSENAKAAAATAKTAAEKAKVDSEKSAKTAAEKAAVAKAAKDKASKEKAAAAKTAAEKVAKTAAEKAAAAKAAAAKAAAKAAADKAAAAKAAAEKTAKEKAKARSEVNYAADLAKLGIPSIVGRERDYNAAIDRACGLYPDFLAFMPHYEGDYYVQGMSLHTLEYNLQKAQQLYEQKVKEQDTSRFLGIFGDDIDSASRKVQEARAELSKGWSAFKSAYAKAKGKVNGIQGERDRAASAKRDAEAKLAKLDQYNPDNGKEVQWLIEEIKDKQSDIDDFQKKIDQFEPLRKMFGL
ncbi:hypothetical protein AUK22_00625 [bacterium CG2_30_54_10]|nr:MAG: hypothetical protein AUK22_00625 [bacterium CG2_30_54_10]